MAKITIEVDGKAEFDRTFTRMDAAFTDLTPIWPDVRDEFWSIEKEQFASEGSAGRDGKWQKLNDRYAKQKIRQYGSGLKILQATGDMMRSLTGETSDTLYQTSKTEIAIGTTLERAKYHHRGGGRLPKRSPINFSDAQRTRLMKVIQVSLIKQLRSGSGYVEPRDR